MTDPRLPGLSFDDARTLVESTIEAGRARGFPPLAAAVVDVTGEVVVLHRSEGAKPITSRLAVAKARTALLALMPSGATEAFPDGIVASLRAIHDGEFVTRAGGVLVVRDGTVEAALGASGAASEQDEEAAQAALDSWLEGTRR